MIPDDDEPPLTPAEERAAMADNADDPGNAPAGPPRQLRSVPTRIDLYDTEAEAALLGAAMLSATARDHLASIDPGHFGDPSHGHIAAAISDLHAEGQPVDAVTVADHLRRHSLLELAGGRDNLTHLVVATPATSSAGHYASIIRDLAQLRALGNLGTEIAAMATAPGATPASAAGEAQALLDQIHDSTTASTSHLHAVAELLDDYTDTIEARAEQPLAGITTGLVDLDKATGGLQNGRLYTIAGRPGLGKSDVAAALARASAGAGHPTLVVSIEMARSEVLDRWVAALSRLPATNLGHGHIAPADWDHISPALLKLQAMPLWIDDDPGATIATIRADVRRSGAQVVIVDYLQLVDTPKAESRQIEVTTLARALKRMARELDIPVVALAQLNRGVEGRTDKRPQLSDLRESGAIEQESDGVIGLYRDDYYNPDSPDRGVLELLLLKNRTGPTTTVKVAYMPDTKIIANLVGAN